MPPNLMINVIYRTGIFFLKIFIPIFALLNIGRLRLWHHKQKNAWRQIKSLLTDNTAPLIWVHAASRGETEQALPLIKLLKKKYPNHKVFLTIFSPSGDRQLEEVDFLAYLPLDTPRDAKRLIKYLNPQLVVWVKYDLWYFYLQHIHKNKIPLLLISSIFTAKKFNFFKRKYYRKVLSFFTHIHVQNKASKTILTQHQIHNVSVSGDTRFDRVYHLSQTIKHPKFSFIPENKSILVCGSIYPYEYNMLRTVSHTFPDIYIVLVPHHINEKNIQKLISYFPKALLYSQLKDEMSSHNAIIIDKIGILMSLYAVSNYCYVGGGFVDGGLHNLLEPASFGKAVLFGPRFQAYQEAVDMQKYNIAHSINNTSEFIRYIHHLQQNPQQLKQINDRAKEYIVDNSKVADKILESISLKK